MYQVGQLVQYGGTGVCRVSEIKAQQFPDSQERLYYIMRPLYQSCVISVPVDSEKVFIRPIISREEADRLICLIPTLNCPAVHCRASRELSERYDAMLKSHNCQDWMELTLSISAKKRAMLQQKRKFGSVDERFLKQAEDMLFGEFAAALEIPKDQVRGYIDAKLESLQAS
ncbi:hypothetical protein D7X94_11585 [Acutalibacter sp. 1XD8-33]|uniref:CarD family transcriptional regulator n=1 Tax=Acutalibacter sp. 1XD8-33 TaxID=2320081 RepID=UPI000EA2614D|nr:CarD family transcriptional regulator [Acutalibacter sp. 1XD8-33]RKJ39598.1 hypothetical protein D7X94_11585 [Acutalibacter sp. 1XD8-33]